MREALLHAHWLEVQRHVYAHAWHGTATTLPGWEVFIWQHFARRQLLLCPSHPNARLEQAHRFLRSYPGISEPGTNVMIETCAGIHQDVEAQLAHGLQPLWGVGYELPGHFIPTNEDWCADTFAKFNRRAPATAPGGILEVKIVADEATAADFAYVQDKAYQASYDWPRGCAAMFYSDSSSLVGPDTLGAVLYENDRPVRTAQIVHKRGIVGGIAGAAVPSVRGRHLGELLITYLATKAREIYGVDVVHHVTMPVARPIATRLGLEEVSLYRRWVRTLVAG